MYFQFDESAHQKLDELISAGTVPVSLLMAIPELAKQPRMIRALKEDLLNPFLNSRVMRAEVLDHIGEPEGTDHLVFNSLAYHPQLKCRQVGLKEWAHNGVRIADKLNEKHVELMVKDMVEHQVFHGPTLAYARVDTVVPAMLNLLDAGLTVRRFASYVLAYHGNAAGAETLRDWAVASPYPKMPLEALTQLPGDGWTAFLEPFADPSHPVYRHERYGSMSKCTTFPSLRIRLALKKLISVQEKIDFSYRMFGNTLTEVEVYTGSKKHDKAIREVDPPVTVLTCISKAMRPHLLWAHDILTDLGDLSLQAYLAERQLAAVKQLIERADLRFENLLDGKLKEMVGFLSMHRVRGLHATGFLKEDAIFYSVPVKIYYDLDDYLQASVDWILNPLRHRSLEFGYVME